MSIGKNVKLFRKQLGISQRELARRIDMTGQMISRIEQETTTPSMDTLRRIAIALKIPFYTLLGEDCECSRELIIAIDQVYPYRESSFSILDILSRDTSIHYEELHSVINKGSSLSKSQEDELFMYLKGLDYDVFQELYQRFRRDDYYSSIVPCVEKDIYPILKNYITEEFKAYGIPLDDEKITKIVDDILEFKSFKIYELLK